MKLNLGELLLLDWITSAQGEKASAHVRDDLMRWRDLRERVWRSIIFCGLGSDAEVSMDLQLAECEELLCLLPTTFRWGTGEDVGYSLKMGLASELWGSEETDRHAGLERVRAMLKERTDADDIADESNAENLTPDPA